jgi:AraC family ethanolamine operon transcriptional activator
LESVRTVDQSRVTVVDITDPAGVNTDFGSIKFDALKLQTTPFRARRIAVRLDAVTVVFHATDLRLRTRTHARDGSLAYVVFGPGVRGAVNGLPVRPGLLLAVEPGTDAEFVTESGWQTVTLLAAPDALRVHLEQRHWQAPLPLPRGVGVLQVPAKAALSLFRHGKRLVTAAARRPALFDAAPAAGRAAGAAMIDELLAALATATTFQLERRDRTRRGYSRIVQRVEDHALQRPGELLGITDFCRVAAVGERTLEIAFKEVMGLSPVAYLKRLRLTQVRKALLVAQGRTTTVSAEAFRWGFWHFGEFSRAYKAYFGELPSQTLRAGCAPAASRSR